MDLTLALFISGWYIKYLSAMTHQIAGCVCESETERRGVFSHMSSQLASEMELLNYRLVFTVRIRPWCRVLDQAPRAELVNGNWWFLKSSRKGKLCGLCFLAISRKYSWAGTFPNVIVHYIKNYITVKSFGKCCASLCCPEKGMTTHWASSSQCKEATLVGERWTHV